MKIGIILGTNRLSGLKFAGIETGMRASMGDKVLIFVTMDGIKAFLKEPEIDTGKGASELLSQKDPDFRKMLSDAKADGFCNVYACYYAAHLYGAEKGDFDELVDDIWGITKFSVETDDAQIISIW